MINEETILKKIKKYAASPEGKQKIQEKREEAFKNNKKFGEPTGENSVVSTKDYAKLASKWFKYFLDATSDTHNLSLIEIAAEAMMSAVISKPEKIGEGLYKVGITFDKKQLRRESLTGEDFWGSEYKTGDGIDNILALFNNGMDISYDKPVPYGKWETHGIYVRATTHRDALQFMQKALQEYMNIYRKSFNIKSGDIGDAYKK